MTKAINKEVVKNEEDLEAVDKSKEVSNDELEIEKEKNLKLTSEVDELKTMMAQILKNQKLQEAKIAEVPQEIKKETALDKYKSIDPNERILIMNMVSSGGTYTTFEGHPVRFDFFGQVQPIKFRDLESLHSRYMPYFKNLEIRILNDDVVDALYLRNDYNKNDITKEELENIIDLEPQEMIAKIKTLTRPLQESVITLIIQKASENDSRYLDMNKWVVLNNTFGIDIASMLENFAPSTKE